MKSHLSDPDMLGRYPITHWLMMGVSENGAFSGADRDYTGQYSSCKEKETANLTEIKNRIKMRSGRMWIDLLEKKLQRVWGDGTDECYEFNSTDSCKHILYDFFYGTKSAVFSIYMQAYRIMSFIGIILATSFLVRERKRYIEFLYLLTLFGAILFFLIWEANYFYSIAFTGVILVIMQFGYGRAIQKTAKI